MPTDDLLTRARRAAATATSDERGELIGRLCDRLAEVTRQRDGMTDVAATFALFAEPEDLRRMADEADPVEAARLAAMVFPEGGSDAG
jgi:hypothetical protein